MATSTTQDDYKLLALGALATAVSAIGSTVGHILENLVFFWMFTAWGIFFGGITLVKSAQKGIKWLKEVNKKRLGKSMTIGLLASVALFMVGSMNSRGNSDHYYGSDGSDQYRDGSERIFSVAGWSEQRWGVTLAICLVGFICGCHIYLKRRP